MVYREGGMLLVIAWALVAPMSSLAAEEGRQERIHFAAGKSSATVSGTIKGDEYIDYLLGATAGQTMTVSMATTNASTNFNVTAPGADAALFIGSVSGNAFTGTLSASGDYTVRVYLMRNAARRQETAKYSLSLAITDGDEAPKEQHGQ